MGESLGMIVFFGFLAAIILVPIWLRERTKQSAHHLISQALEKGQQLDPALMRQLTEGANRNNPRDRARRTLGAGIILAALAGGFVGAAFIIGDLTGVQEAESGMLIPAVILGALAAAFILLALVDFATKKRDE
ncbi:MAG: hypothetical protein R3C16_07895 [Hyphomonadaceae bacterium]